MNIGPRYGRKMKTGEVRPIEMNLCRIYLIAILLLAFSACVNGQESPKAVLADEHGLFPCDDTLGRLDAWYAELSNNPNSIGLAVISGPPEKKHLSVFRQYLMDANPRFRGASKELQLKYVRANSPGEVKIQLWRVPAWCSRADHRECRHVL